MNGSVGELPRINPAAAAPILSLYTLVPSAFEPPAQQSRVDRASIGTHNPRSVFRFSGRVATSLILVPIVALAATVAPQHVHEADADHPHSTVHRHLQPHSTGSHDRDHARLADDDAHVLWLDGAQISSPRYQFAAPLLIPVDRFEATVPFVEWIARPDYETPPPHGPPKASLALRAPPPSPPDLI